MSTTGETPTRPLLVLAVGGGLTLLGVVAYAATGASSATALIPSAFGVLLLAAGLLRSRLGRAADVTVLVVAAVGLLGSLRVFAVLPDALSGEGDVSAWAVGSQLVLLVLCGWVLVAGALARVRSRRAAAVATPPEA